MAAPAVTSDVQRGSRTRVISFSQSGANDGNIDFELNRPLASLTFQLAGTYSAGTIKMQASNDGTNYADTPTAASLAANGLKGVAALDLGFRYYRLNFASMGSGNTHTGAIVAKFYN
jgi:hypothetical protein